MIELKYGTTRIVLLLGKYAIKFPAVNSWQNFLLGMVSNINESRLSKVVQLPGFPRFCPVLFSFPGGLFNVMPRTKPIDRESFFNMDMSWCMENGPIENKLDSFGMLGGEVVAVDYNGW